jgi:hypothetical protein
MLRDNEAVLYIEYMMVWSIGLNVHTCATCQPTSASTYREGLVLDIKLVKHDMSVKKKSAIDGCYWPMRTAESTASQCLFLSHARLGALPIATYPQR